MQHRPAQDLPGRTDPAADRGVPDQPTMGQSATDDAAPEEPPGESPPGGVLLQLADARLRLPAGADVPGWAQAALAAAGHPAPVQLAVRVVEEAEGQALNRDYRGKDRPTNVLSFPAPPLPPGVPVDEDGPELGDIVICLPVVLAEAADQGKTPLAHLAHLVVHGTLHLLGYTHDGDEDAREMEALETRILAGLGFPDPYPG